MIYAFLADGFEETEAICPIDLLRRAGFAVTTVAVGTTGRTVKGAHGIPVEADVTEADIAPDFENDPPELLFLPGGMPGTTHLGESTTVRSCLVAAAADGCPTRIAAICAAPSVPGSLGLLAGREATCFPGFEASLIGARLMRGKKAVVDREEKFITGIGMGAAFEFGLSIVGVLAGKGAADALKKAVLF